jgi:hypothetical protein
LDLHFVHDDLVVLCLVEAALGFKEVEIIDCAPVKTRFGDVVGPVRTARKLCSRFEILKASRHRQKGVSASLELLLRPASPTNGSNAIVPAKSCCN